MTETPRPTTTSDPQRRTIRAEIASHAINRVTSFYDAAISSIFTEIYQNARRARATQVQVEIDYEKRTVTVADDGLGIENPESVLSFGRSDWNEHDDEHPAGMGLYSLSRRGAEIISRTRKHEGAAWRTILEPKHFQGDESANVESVDATGPVGTTIIFPIVDNDDCPETAALTQARYLPLKVTIGGTAVPQEAFLDPARLAGIVHEPDLAFGVSLHDAPVDTKELTINFHGHIVTDGFMTPIIWGLESAWTATVDVKRCRELELVLPAREKIIRNGYLNRLVERMETAIYEVIAEQDKPQSLIFKHAQRAKELGFEVRLTEDVLLKWAQMPADPDWHGYPVRETGATPHDAIIVTRRLNGNQTGMLERALVCEEEDIRRAGADPEHATRRRLFAEAPAFKGFTWYDTMPQAVDLHVEIEIDGKRSRVHPMDNNNRTADKVWAVLSVRRPDGTIETVRIETDMALSCDDTATHPESAGLILSKSRANDREAIAHAVDRALFMTTDQCADGPMTQNTAFEADLDLEMTTLLDGCDAALESAIQNALVNLPPVPSGTEVHMTSADGKAWKITTTVPANSAEHQNP